MGGVTIVLGSLKTKGNKKILRLGQNFFSKSYITPIYLLKIVFPRYGFPGMALCVDFGPKCQNLFCLVWD